jgi:quinol monooxygenase YgiN
LEKPRFPKDKRSWLASRDTKGEKSMVHATVRMVIPPHKRAEALEILNLVAERCRAIRGCLTCRIYHDEQVEAVFMLEEMWETQGDLDRHLRSNDYRNVLLVTEMAVEPPEIKFQTISHSAGIEIIEKARACTKE